MEPTRWVHADYQSADQLKLFYRVWSPSSAQRTLLIIHGFGEHSGRYEKFAHFFKGTDFRIVAVDLRGMGRSEGARGYARSLDDYLDDIDLCVNLLQEQFGSDPLYLLGHSFGGLCAFHYALKYSEKLCKLAISSPLMGLPNEALIFPINLLINKVSPKFKFHRPINSKYLTHDPKEKSKRSHDDLILKYITSGLLNIIIKSSRDLRLKEKISISMPVLFLLAGQDRVVDLKSSLAAFEKLEPVTLREKEIFPDCYHEIFNEISCDHVFSSLKRYLLLEMS